MIKRLMKLMLTYQNSILYGQCSQLKGTKKKLNISFKISYSNRMLIYKSQPPNPFFQFCMLFWSSLVEKDKNKFTIFELNAILYLVSPQYNKYQKKDKQKIIRFIDQVVREMKLENSYKTIKV